MPSKDIVIIGGGPAGLAAGLYAVRAGVETLLIEKLSPGGQAILAERIENYPGFPEGISGGDLMSRIEKQARGFGLEVVSGEAIGIVQDAKCKIRSEKVVRTEDKEYGALAVIVASGAEARRLQVPGEEELRGKGVSYCATCDGPFFKDQDIVVIGGGDTAVGEALFLTKFAKKVTIVHRRDRLRASKILQQRALGNKGIGFIWKSVVTKILGDGTVEGIRVRNVKTGKVVDVPCKGVFVAAGITPNTGFLKGFVDIDEQGYVKTDENKRTSQEGIYACGDCRKKLLRQVVTACGEGATAAFAATKYVEELKGVAY
jgi:thioredoxin reductase (NADPH)